MSFPYFFFLVVVGDHAHTHIYVYTHVWKDDYSLNTRTGTKTYRELLVADAHVLVLLCTIHDVFQRKERGQTTFIRTEDTAVHRTPGDDEKEREREREAMKAFLVVMVYFPESMPGASADNKTEQNVPPSRCGDVRRCRRCRQRQQCTPAPQRTISFATLPSQLHEHASRASGSTDTQRFPINQRYISSDHCLPHICLK